MKSIEIDIKNYNNYLFKQNQSYIVYKEILYSDQIFDGLINHLRKDSTIDDEIKISVSSKGLGDLKNLILYEDTTKNFHTTNSPNSWICFEFLKHQIIPTNYTIRSHTNCKNTDHPKSWKIEGSNNKKEWQNLFEENNSTFLNCNNLIHTFSIRNETKEPFKYLRIYQTGPNCLDRHYLQFDSIEFYGKLI